MAIRVVGQLAEKAQELLGGKNPTERRIQALLNELEQLRAQSGIKPTAESPDLIGNMTAEEIHAGLTVQDMIDEKIGDPGQIVTGEPGTILPRVSVPTGDGEPAPGEPELIVDPMMKLLLEKLSAMETQIADLRKPTPEQEKEAVDQSKLPPPSMQPPPRGYAGLHEMPVGKWVKSPLGPKVDYKICGCGKCTPYRLNHYFCVICHRGPFHYQQRYPHFTKAWMAPGQVWGISHHCCSEPCRMSYLGVIGVTPGLNDHEPPRAAGQADEDLEALEPGQERPEPTRIVVAHGSD